MPLVSCGQLRVIEAGEDWTAALTWTLASQVFSTAAWDVVKQRVATNSPKAAIMVRIIAPAIMRQALQSLYPCGSDRRVSLADEAVSVSV